MTSPFAIVPVEVCMDPRLTKMQLRVLIALLSFRAKNTDTVWPKREQISIRCGYAVGVISRVTSQLVALGWLEKVGKGGFSKSVEYRITVPDLEPSVPCETVASSVTVDSEKSTQETANNGGQFGNGNQLGNGDQSTTNNGDQTGQQTVTSSVTRNKQTMNRQVSDHYIPTTRKTRWPDNFILTGRLRGMAIEYWQRKDRSDLCVDVVEIFSQFKNDALAKGKSFNDWNRAWATWYSNAIKFSRKPYGSSNGNSQAGQSAVSRNSEIAAQRERERGSSQSSSRASHGSVVATVG